MANQGSAEPQRDLKQERWELLEHINTLTDKPMVALSFVWLLLIIVGFTHGLSRTLQIISDIILGAIRIGLCARDHHRPTPARLPARALAHGDLAPDPGAAHAAYLAGDSAAARPPRHTSAGPRAGRGFA